MPPFVFNFQIPTLLESYLIVAAIVFVVLLFRLSKGIEYDDWLSIGLSAWLAFLGGLLWIILVACWAVLWLTPLEKERELYHY